ncbi:MAG: hypothetical protein JXR51_02200 [Bacteroidales bacterium]|nr:hypothetical protein [Bacteroidales bacterium]MBN2755959.1 hypothetical protein [Bacteroidales bacterium]
MKTILLICLFFIQTLLHSQNYYVIKVRGEILCINSGKLLKQGDNLNLNDKLKFKSANAYALVMNNKREKFHLKLPERMEATVDEFTAYTKNSLIAVNDKLNTRGGVAFESQISNLSKYFGNSDFTIIGNKLSVNLNKKTYKLNQTQKIIAKYQFENNAKQLVLNNDSNSICLSENKFQIPENEYFELNLYLQKSDISKEFITQFNLRFIAKTDIENEFLTIVKSFKSTINSESEMKVLLKKYFSAFYGKTDNFLLHNLCNKVIKENM